ncbi:unnamed protein product [Arabidopsis thaliana]|uniref:(thale cress) hypothetical protein n=1 Tax=Arabidopsis thaliana TaxID=3702 RepID=A0A654EI75_ARATH|nr:unnamed protein product [Arabidopsis thaliana]VYS49026.1 unnamed protein product [Arabidopsis thaliana]
MVKRIRGAGDLIGKTRASIRNDTDIDFSGNLNNILLMKRSTGIRSKYSMSCPGVEDGLLDPHTATFTSETYWRTASVLSLRWTKP